MDETRQAFELALLAATHHYTEKPVLGVCLGMQLMALSAGGRLDQHMPDTIGDQAAGHINDSRHTIEINGEDSVLNAGISIDGCQVVSRHHQAVADAGSLRVIATSPDGVIEAIDDPGRPFFLGVQWHPERGGEGVINQGLIQRFVSACRSAT